MLKFMRTEGTSFLFSHVYDCTVVNSVIDCDGQLEYGPCRKNNIQSGHCISCGIKIYNGNIA